MAKNKKLVAFIVTLLFFGLSAIANAWNVYDISSEPLAKKTQTITKTGPTTYRKNAQWSKHCCFRMFKIWL